jgi:hypothetical protein
MFTNSKKNKYKVTVLANNLDELITRDPTRFLRSLEQEKNISEQLWERWCRRMDQIAGNCHYIFQLDCAPAHNNKRPQVWLKESLTEVCEKEIWPLSFPDCNRLDCITFGVSELRVNLKPHNKTENLLPKIKEVIESFDRNTIEKKKTCKRLRSRSKVVFAADSSLTE